MYNSGDEGHDWMALLYNLESLYYGQTNFEYEGIPPHIAGLTNLVEYDCSYTLYNGPIEGAILGGLESLGKVLSFDLVKFVYLDGVVLNSLLLLYRVSGTQWKRLSFSHSHGS